MSVLIILKVKIYNLKSVKDIYCKIKKVEIRYIASTTILSHKIHCKKHQASHIQKPASNNLTNSTSSRKSCKKPLCPDGNCRGNADKPAYFSADLADFWNDSIPRRQFQSARQLHHNR